MFVIAEFLKNGKLPGTTSNSSAGIRIRNFNGLSGNTLSFVRISLMLLILSKLGSVLELM